MLLLRNIAEQIYNVITYIVIGVGILLVTIYAHISYVQLFESQDEKELLESAENYVNDINSTITRYHNITEIVGISLAKTSKHEGFFTNAENIIRSCMMSYSDIQLATLVINETSSGYDNVFLDDSTLVCRLNLVNKDNKINSIYLNYEEHDKKFKQAISKLIPKEQTKVLNPKSLMINDKFSTVYPIVSIMYRGNYLVGYLIFYVNINSEKNKYSSNSDYEIFAFTESGKLLSSNVSSVFLNDDISKICSSCTINTEKNEQVIMSADGVKTLCFSYSLANSNEIWHVCIRKNENKRAILKTLLIIWLLSLLAMATAFAVIYYKFSAVKTVWQKAGDIIERILKGNADTDELKTIDESGQAKLKNAILAIDNILKTLVGNSNKILTGALKVDRISHFNEDIHKTHTLLYRRFIKSQKELRYNKNKLKQLEITNKNLEFITELVRNNYSDVVAMLDLMIKRIVSLLDFEMGSVFLKTTEGDTVFLEQVVSYAYNEKKENKVRFKLGDSLIGACAAEKRIIHLRKIPKDYLKIISGLGDTPPTRILIMPLLFEDEALGVIELGSVNAISPDTIRFIERIAINISVILYLAENNSLNKELLKKSEIDKKFIADQNKTIKDSLDELQKIHNKTTKREAFVKAKLEAAGHALMMAEYSPIGQLLDANFKFLNTLHYSLEELTNKSIIELIDKGEGEKTDKIINSVKIGSSYETIVYMNTKDNNKKEIYSVYAPLFDDTGTLENILFFGVDITELNFSTNA